MTREKSTVGLADGAQPGVFGLENSYVPFGGHDLGGAARDADGRARSDHTEPCESVRTGGDDCPGAQSFHRSRSSTDTSCWSRNSKVRARTSRRTNRADASAADCTGTSPARRFRRRGSESIGTDRAGHRTDFRVREVPRPALRVAEFDAIEDSTQSFNDLAGNGLIARPGSFAAGGARTTFSVRNSRLGLKMSGPGSDTVKTSGIIKKNGWGVSIDALLPVVPATKDDHANALTLTGSFVTGSGISDLYTGLTGGIGFPSLPIPSGATAAPPYPANIDAGLVTYDANGNLHTIDWRSFIVGVQYYLPVGNLWVSANYSQMHSGNIASYGADPTKVFKDSNWVDGNLFWDANGAARFGLEYAHFQQKYADDKKANNDRVQLSAFYIF